MTISSNININNINNNNNNNNNNDNQNDYYYTLLAANSSGTHSHTDSTTDVIRNSGAANQSQVAFAENLYEITRQVTGLYLFPFISILGIVGNVFIVIIYQKSQKYSTNIYLIALSLSDILKLANDFLYFLVNAIGKWDAQLSQKMFNHLYFYSHFVFLFTAINTSWLTCTIALDRYVAVVRNSNTKQKQSDCHKSIIICLLIFVFSAIITTPSPFFLVHDTDTAAAAAATATATATVTATVTAAVAATVTATTTAATASASVDTKHSTGSLNALLANESARKLYNYFNALVKAFLPLILLVYLDYMIIAFVYKNKMKMKAKRNNNNKKNKQRKPKSRVSLMLITIVLTFTICMFPDAIMTMMNLGYANENYLVRAIREITDLLLAVNSAVTFPICYLFSIQFRGQFKQLFGIKSNALASTRNKHRTGNDLDENTSLVAVRDRVVITMPYSNNNNNNNKNNSSGQTPALLAVKTNMTTAAATVAVSDKDSSFDITSQKGDHLMDSSN